jgi:hypothetical protein
MALLDKSRINYSLIVPQADLEYYQENFSNADILTVPDGKVSIGAGFARQKVYDICREQGYPYVWILDDDINAVIKEDGKPSTLRALFSTLERWIEDYSNVAMLGVHHVTDRETPYVLPPIEVNAAVRGLMLVNLQTGEEGFNSMYKLYEDYEFTLRHIYHGWTSIVYNGFGIGFAEIPGGGASALYVDSDDAEALNKVYPECTELLYYVQNLPPSISIDWKVFTSALRSRHVDLLMKGE